MNEYNYLNYYSSNNQDHTIHSLDPKELDYNVLNDEQISKKRENVISKLISKQNIRLRNKYPTR